MVSSIPTSPFFSSVSSCVMSSIISFSSGGVSGGGSGVGGVELPPETEPPVGTEDVSTGSVEGSS